MRKSKIEFMTRTDGTILVMENEETQPLSDREDVINTVHDIIEADYPEAYSALYCKYHTSKKSEEKTKEDIVSRFLRCNCGNYDPHKFDLSNGELFLELVPCPLRGGECEDENIICRAKKSGTLTKCQYQVAKLLAAGYSRESIADLLQITRSTLKQHVASIHRKLELSNDAEIANYING